MEGERWDGQLLSFFSAFSLLLLRVLGDKFLRPARSSFHKVGFRDRSSFTLYVAAGCGASQQLLFNDSY